MGGGGWPLGAVSLGDSLDESPHFPHHTQVSGREVGWQGLLLHPLLDAYSLPINHAKHTIQVTQQL